MPARTTAFDAWWTEPITKYGDDGLWSRKDHVLAMANKEGGADVDPNLNEDYEVLVTDNALGVHLLDGGWGFRGFPREPCCGLGTTDRLRVLGDVRST